MALDIKKTLMDRGRSQETADAIAWFIRHAPRGNKLYDSLRIVASDSLTDNRVTLSPKQIGKIKGLYEMSKLRHAEEAPHASKRIEELADAVTQLTDTVESMAADIDLLKRAFRQLVKERRHE